MCKVPTVKAQGRDDGPHDIAYLRYVLAVKSANHKKKKLKIKKIVTKLLLPQKGPNPFSFYLSFFLRKNRLTHGSICVIFFSRWQHMCWLLTMRFYSWLLIFVILPNDTKHAVESGAPSFPLANYNVASNSSKVLVEAGKNKEGQGHSQSRVIVLGPAGTQY